MPARQCHREVQLGISRQSASRRVVNPSIRLYDTIASCPHGAAVPTRPAPGRTGCLTEKSTAVGHAAAHHVAEATSGIGRRGDILAHRCVPLEHVSLHIVGVNHVMGLRVCGMNSCLGLRCVASRRAVNGPTAGGEGWKQDRKDEGGKTKGLVHVRLSGSMGDVGRGQSPDNLGSGVGGELEIILYCKIGESAMHRGEHEQKPRGSLHPS